MDSEDLTNLIKHPFHAWVSIFLKKKEEGISHPLRGNCRSWHSRPGLSRKKGQVGKPDLRHGRCLRDSTHGRWAALIFRHRRFLLIDRQSQILPRFGRLPFLLIRGGVLPLPMSSVAWECIISRKNPKSWWIYVENGLWPWTAGAWKVWIVSTWGEANLRSRPCQGVHHLPATFTQGWVMWGVSRPKDRQNHILFQTWRSSRAKQNTATTTTKQASKQASYWGSSGQGVILMMSGTYDCQRRGRRQEEEEDGRDESRFLQTHYPRNCSIYRS